jgi:hypothetical protein
MLTWYEVTYNFQHVYHIEAKSADAAKRIACHYQNVSPSDYWCGLSLCSAHKMTLEEVEKIERWA